MKIGLRKLSCKNTRQLKGPKKAQTFIPAELQYAHFYLTCTINSDAV